VCLPRLLTIKSFRTTFFSGLFSLFRRQLWLRYFLAAGILCAYSVILTVMKSLSFIAVACALLLTITSAWAEGNSIRGVVTDRNGKRVPGAEIRAERTDAKGPAAAATTDANGQYALNHLALGTYKLVASYHKTPGSAATIKTSDKGWVRVDFAMKDMFGGQIHRDQSATDRVQGQDMRRMMMDQAGGH
jgi:hypothetical protein